MRVRLILALFVSIFFMSGALADQYTILGEFRGINAKCYASGQAELEFTQKQYRIVHLEDTVKGKGARLGNGSYFPITGRWYDKNYNPVVYINDVEPVLFITDEFTFKTPGYYDFRFAGIPIDIVDFYSDVSTVEFKDVYCPGYLHSCRHLNPEIINCFTGEEFFYTYFKGLGEKQYSFVNLTRDLGFYLNYDKFEGTTLGVAPPLPPGSQLLKLGNDTYLLKIPLPELSSKVNSVMIHVTGCIEGLHNTTAYKTCTFPVKQPKLPAPKPPEYIPLPEKCPSLPSNMTSYCLSVLNLTELKCEECNCTQDEQEEKEQEESKPNIREELYIVRLVRFLARLIPI